MFKKGEKLVFLYDKMKKTYSKVEKFGNKMKNLIIQLACCIAYLALLELIKSQKQPIRIQEVFDLSDLEWQDEQNEIDEGFESDF